MSSLVIAEHDNSSIKPSTLNTVTAAAQCGGDVHVLVAGHNAGAAAAAAAQIAGVSKVIHVEGEGFGHGLAENIGAQVVALASGYSHLLFPATAFGKNIAPQKIENMLKEVRYLSNGMVLGDHQKYVTALITLNEQEVLKWARAQGIPFNTYEELIKNDELGNDVLRFL